MATRDTRLVIKNSDIVNRPLPTTLLNGEGIVNTAEGIMLFSGVSSSTNEWTPAGTNTDFFEVGSNLYDLQIRNKIIKYGGISDLTGKYLKGTSNGFELDDITSIVGVDSFVTSVNFLNNELTLERNNSLADLSVTIDSFTDLKISSLTEGRVIYVGVDGELTDEAGFEYDDSTNTLQIDNINTSSNGSAFIGTGGLTVGSGGNTNTSGNGDVIIHGSLTVFGESITASTSELYIEDNNIILNYNPGSDTSASSIGAGFTIQDGDGLNGDISLDIRAMDSFSGIDGNTPNVSEYSGPTGVSNRAFVTQLNDIVIRSTNSSTPNGVRVLAEFDTLDGGSY